MAIRFGPMPTLLWIAVIALSRRRRVISDEAAGARFAARHVPLFAPVTLANRLMRQPPYIFTDWKD